MTLAENSFAAKFSRFKKRVEGRLEQGFYAETRGYGLRRDLAEAWPAPKAKIPISVRPLEISDLSLLLPLEGNIPPEEQQQIRWRRHFHKKFPHRCFVAVDERNDRPCYMQWLVYADDNDALERFKCFPKLRKNEAILEQAYTIPSHRGLGIMSSAMAEIAEQAVQRNVRYVMTFVDTNGIASIKACQRAGFRMHLHQHRIQLGYGLIVRNNFLQFQEDDKPSDISKKLAA
ncbi:MAG TPA: GNAT family N-acetyltransferase [Patescibacteria group bacterium]|jgi:RimJ/RimL family protein N-acetyltransferase|nr:GNAT family N-acetyltransferase [Patescibacteria group bacterium]